MSADDLYREFEHTGDLGIEVEGRSREELLARATTALARVMVEPETVRAIERCEIEVRDGDDSNLLHDLLAEALNKFLIDGFIWREAAVAIRDGSPVATLAGEKFDSRRHQLLTEIKAVTYHRLAVEHEGDKWRATIVFDV